MTYIATFYAHFGAIRYKKQCEAAGLPAKIMPVPRSLSSSCGTCVSFESENDWPFPSHPDEIEQIVLTSDGGYHPVYQTKE